MKYLETYKDKTFFIWYRLGKPSPTKLKTALEPDSSGNTPSVPKLSEWIQSWSERASELDIQVSEEMDRRMIHEKVEMLRRHSALGKELQEKSLELIRDNYKTEDWLSGNTALRMLVEGVKIERKSTGIPGMLDKVINSTDQDLLEQINKLLVKGDISGNDLETLQGELSEPI